ncbi:MAG: hypothetical protein RLY72_447 [Planctomycetota bacterium]
MMPTVMPTMLLSMLPTMIPSMGPWVFEVLGWVPAIIFPAASGLQLLTIVHRRNADGVSIPAWAMFAVANLCLFVYTEKYGEMESIVGALGTSGLNLCIVVVSLQYRRKS